MLFSCNVNELKKAMEMVKPAVYARGLPILASVKLEADAGLTLTTTNLEFAIRYRIEAQVDEPGVHACSHKDLLAIMKKLPKGESVEISHDDSEHIHVGCRGLSYTLPGFDPAEFPEIAVNSQTVEVTGLSGAVYKCLSFVSCEDTRPQLNGVHLSNNGDLHCVGTNGKALKAIRLNGEGEPFEATLPTAACSVIAKSFPDAVQIAVDAEHATIRDGNLTIVTRLIDGIYPDWQAVIDCVNKERELSFDREEFATVMDRVAVVLPGRRNGHPESRGVQIETCGTGIRLTAKSGTGEATGLLNAEGNGDFTSRVDVDTMATVLGSIDSEKATLHTAIDGPSPILVAGVENEKTVFMPMHL